ncbi:Hypothetical predicted protein [Paramuricea clavata]|uniref:Uncharacterized protein n=1 Tax=Paramuricea clavata TaxID=317549 RepID=A0A6S7I0Z6_PARCT|nr:Hypothetical predicted protein [Paramuricea clavata]
MQGSAQDGWQPHEHSTLLSDTRPEAEMSTPLERPGENTEHSQAAANEDSGSIDCQNTQEHAEKKLRGLKKKIQQIEKLKSKQDEGEVLEDLQIAKIQSEEAILKEIDELQERLEQM